MQEKKQIKALTGARFAAIMIIVGSHFEFLYQYSIGSIYYNYFHNATMGVDFFFMLSGFGMMLSSIKTDPAGKKQNNTLKSLLNYSFKHVSKIYPLYVATLLIGIPYYMMHSIIENGKSFFEASIHTISKFIVCLTLLQSTTGMMRFSHGLNAVCWFLSTLFCIYIISPIIMRYLKRKIKTTKEAMLFIIISIFCSFIFAIVLEWVEKNTIFDMICFGSPYRRIFYVICGMITAQIYTFNRNCTIKITFEYLSIILSIIWFFMRNTISYKIGAFIYIIDMILCIFVLYALAFEKGKISFFFASKKMVYLGNISMYIFITHFLIREYVDFIVRQLNLQSLLTASIEIVIILLFTFIVSIMLEKYYHKK